MEFLIAKSFNDSLAKLSAEEQRAVKVKAYDLQVDPANPGIQLHKLDRSKDPNFWSGRVTRDLRVILHRTGTSTMMCYAGHHDDAYAWAERRKIETHPKTGAAQIVEVRERVERVTIQVPVPQPAEEAAPEPLFAHLSDDELLDYGVPAEWLDDVRQANENDLYDLIDHLPDEAGEALVCIATGGEPEVVAPQALEADPFAHPDAQRRFRVMENAEELARALEYPWEKWAVFLHPAQRRYVEQDSSGSVRISGSAGTGKTVVAMHRAVFLARKYPKARVLVTTFSKVLANALETKLEQLAGNEPEVAGRVTVRPIRGLGYELHADTFGQPNIAPPEKVRDVLEAAAAETEGNRISLQFLWTEWAEVVDAWQLTTWEAYRDVPRLGRKTRIGGKQREMLWGIFEKTREVLADSNLTTWPQVFSRVTKHLAEGADKPFDFAVIDEAQDVSVAELRFLAALGTGSKDSLFFTGDVGQRIFQPPFSWKALGIDVRGRSHTLRVNYRTSHQIRCRADKLLPPGISDVDGIEEDRRRTVSVFDGPIPEIVVYEDEDQEVTGVAAWLKGRLTEGILPHEIGLFVRAHAQRRRAMAAAKTAGQSAIEVGENVATAPGKVSICTMHLAKGLEFRAVAVMACDDEVIPLQERLENVADDVELEEAYTTERHLLYVACTRARDRLLVTGVNPASEFLDDMQV